MSLELFQQTEQKYLQLKAELSAGQLTLNHFDLAVKRATVKDPIGRPWLIDTSSGKWYVYNGLSWVPADPYRTLRRMARASELPRLPRSSTLLGIHVPPPSKTYKAWQSPPPLRSNLAIVAPAKPTPTTLPAWLERSLKPDETGAETAHTWLLTLAALMLLGLLCLLVLLGSALATNSNLLQ